jgi:hypothetical protein
MLTISRISSAAAVILLTLKKGLRSQKNRPKVGHPGYRQQQGLFPSETPIPPLSDEAIP